MADGVRHGKRRRTILAPFSFPSISSCYARFHLLLYIDCPMASCSAPLQRLGLLTATTNSGADKDVHRVGTSCTFLVLSRLSSSGCRHLAILSTCVPLFHRPLQWLTTSDASDRRRKREPLPRTKSVGVPLFYTKPRPSLLFLSYPLLPLRADSQTLASVSPLPSNHQLFPLRIPSFFIVKGFPCNLSLSLSFL